MYKDIFDDINTILSKYHICANEYKEDVVGSVLLSLIISTELSFYLNDFTIMNELYPYELKLKEDINIDSNYGKIKIDIDLYNTSTKSFVIKESKEWNSYKVQSLLKKHKLRFFIENQPLVFS